MSKLIAEGRSPISVAGLMERRLEVLAGASQEEISLWWDYHYDTCDGVFFHPDGNLKVVLGAQMLKDLNPNSPTTWDGIFVLGGDRDSSIVVYNSLDGPEFTKCGLDGKVVDILTPEQAIDHPLWNALVPDKSLLRTYVLAVASLGKARFKYDKNMGICLLRSRVVATGGLWYVQRIVRYSLGCGCNNVTGEDGRLVGVAPTGKK
jgi:hypothetical protein